MEKNGNWHLLPDELFDGIQKIIKTEEVRSFMSAAPKEQDTTVVGREGVSENPASSSLNTLEMAPFADAENIQSDSSKGKPQALEFHSDATLRFLNSTNADGIVSEALRGMRTSISKHKRERGLSQILMNLPRMNNQENAREALLKTWALTLYWCKNAPADVEESKKTSLLHSFTDRMERLQNPVSGDPSFHTDKYTQNANILQKEFYDKAVPKDLYSTFTCVLPPDPADCISRNLFRLGKMLQPDLSEEAASSSPHRAAIVKNSDFAAKCQEAKAVWFTELLEENTGIHSYIDGDKARSNVAQRVVEWRFTHEEGKASSSVLDISGCDVDRMPPIARLRDLPERKVPGSVFESLRKAELTEVNASGNRFTRESLKPLRNLGLLVHVGNNPAINQIAINKLNRWQVRNKTTFTLNVPEQSQASPEQLQAQKTATKATSPKEQESLSRVEATSQQAKPSPTMSGVQKPFTPPRGTADLNPGATSRPGVTVQASQAAGTSTLRTETKTASGKSKGGLGRVFGRS